MVIDHWLGPQFLLVPVQLVLMVWWWKCVIIHLWQAIFFSNLSISNFLNIVHSFGGGKINHNPEMYTTMYLHLSYLSLQNFTLESQPCGGALEPLHRCMPNSEVDCIQYSSLLV